MARAKSEDGSAYRGVALFVNPLTGEEKYFYSAVYGTPGPATAAVSRRLNQRHHGGKFYYHPSQYDAATRSYITRNDDERFPFVERWTEKAENWTRV